MAVIHISEATRKRVLQRGGVMPPPVEPDLAVWRQAEAKRRQQAERELVPHAPARVTRFGAGCRPPFLLP